MEAFFQFLTKIWWTIPGYLQVLLILALAFAMVMWGLNKVIPFLDRRRKNLLRTINKKSLLQHNFFTDLNTILHYNLPKMDFGSEGKNWVANVILQHKLTFFLENTQRMIENTDFCSFSQEECKRIFLANIYDTIEKYELVILQKSTDEDRKLIRHILDKFNEKHFKNGDLILVSIQDIFDSTVHDNMHYKLCSALDLMTVPFDFLLEEMEEVFQKMNGELTGKKIQGKIL